MYKAYFKEKTFYFSFPAYTSRGILTQKKSWFLLIESKNIQGIGEISPLAGLSPEPTDLIKQTLNQFCKFINEGNDPAKFDLQAYPSIRFGLECALRQIEQRQTHLLYPSEFTEGISGIAINGLIWAGNRQYIIEQVKQKIDAGFPCIKMKIGALPFNEELAILKEIRTIYPDLEIRLDANGAFSIDDALNKINTLANLEIHSIEQPIAPKQSKQMAFLCKNSPIPVALDEELIGITKMDDKIKLLDTIRPTYIILKPTLLGGFLKAEEWIKITNELQIGWWITSALESNIGLNALAQWTYSLAPNKIHGLGTGQIYINNISSPLYIENGKLHYQQNKLFGSIDE